MALASVQASRALVSLPGGVEISLPGSALLVSVLALAGDLLSEILALELTPDGEGIVRHRFSAMRCCRWSIGCQFPAVHRGPRDLPVSAHEVRRVPVTATVSSCLRA